MAWTWHFCSHYYCCVRATNLSAIWICSNLRQAQCNMKCTVRYPMLKLLSSYVLMYCDRTPKQCRQVEAIHQGFLWVVELRRVTMSYHSLKTMSPEWLAHSGGPRSAAWRKPSLPLQSTEGPTPPSINHSEWAPLTAIPENVPLPISCASLVWESNCTADSEECENSLDMAPAKFGTRWGTINFSSSHFARLLCMHWPRVHKGLKSTLRPEAYLKSNIYFWSFLRAPWATTQRIITEAQVPNIFFAFNGPVLQPGLCIGFFRAGLSKSPPQGRPTKHDQSKRLSTSWIDGGWCHINVPLGLLYWGSRLWEGPMILTIIAAIPGCHEAMSPWSIHWMW